MPRDNIRRHSKSRSRSPYRESSRLETHHSHRDRDDTDRHSRHHHHKTSRHDRTVAKLPCRAHHLSKNALDAWRPLFALYLDVQKQIYIEDLDEREVKGRWKSFVGKWNRGELAEGWYDPQTREKANASFADASYSEDVGRPGRGRDGSEERRISPARPRSHRHEEESSNDEVGPSAPRTLTNHAAARAAGPTIPNRDDLDMRDELHNEDRFNALSDLRHARKHDRSLQRSRDEEMAPKADAGTHAARLEKKRGAAYAQASYRDAQDPNGIPDLNDNEIMGDDGIDAFRKQKKEMERKKNEREVRKEEVLRARMAEREVVLQARREKEDRTMSMLRELARERFG